MTSTERIRAIYKILRKLFVYPSSIFQVLKDEAEYENYLNKKYKRTLFPTTDITQFLQENKATVDNYTFLDGSSLITDLALLRSLASSFNECVYLEIGTWRGESILNVAACAKQCISVNLSPEEIITRGLPEKYAKLHGCLLNNEENIKTIYADSTKFDFNSLNQKFDLIFIDGDHSYEGVKSDTQKVFPLLKNENSVIVWHDYGYNPEKPRHSVIAGILDGLPVEEQNNLYHVSNTLCAIYTKKKLKSSVQDLSVVPNKTFKINLQAVPFNSSKLNF